MLLFNQNIADAAVQPEHCTTKRKTARQDSVQFQYDTAQVSCMDLRLWHSKDKPAYKLMTSMASRAAAIS
jgi:hypothetical protein